jgi:hypothetical protein
MSIYGDMQNLATNLLTDFNQGELSYIQLVPATGGTIDNPGTPTPVKTPVKGAVRGVSQKYINAGFATGSEKQATINVIAGLNPKNGDQFSVDGEIFTITKVLKKPEAGTTVAYVLILKKG